MSNNRKFRLEGLIPDILYSVKYDGKNENEFRQLFKKWDDPLWLSKFFKANQEDLHSGAWGAISIPDAIRQTRVQAKDMRRKILDIANDKAENSELLSDYFMPLTNGKYGKLEWDKGKGLLNHNWLRIYAVRCSKNTYVITGGGIKLTRDMSPVHLQDEISKLQQAEDYLRSGEDDQIDLCYLDL